MKYEESYFGNCSVCHMTDGCLTVENENWFVCDEHHFRWMAGTGLFSVSYADKWSDPRVLVIEHYTILTLDEAWTPVSQVAEALLQGDTREEQWPR